MKFVATCLLLSALQGCSLMNQELGLKDDNVFEQATEKFIKDETGIEIEFTPHEKTKNVS